MPMKRLLLFAALLFSMGVQPATAQIDLKAGLRLGAALSTFRGDDIVSSSDVPSELRIESNFERLTGLVAGGILLFDLPGPVAVQPEVLYIRKGSDIRVDLSGTVANQPISGSTSFDVTLDYIEVPVLAKFHVPLSRLYTPTLFAGPSVAFKVSEDIDLGASDLEVTEEDDVARSVDTGLVVGGGIDVNVPGYTLLLDARYGFGLSNIAEDDAIDLKNGSIVISAGILF